jgi:heme exporter protein CcmD
MPNLELGKYAVYIVPAYVIAAVVIAALVADTLLRAGRWKREVEKREALRDGKKKKA